ncbi:hypothetical protein [Kitasatospora sp. NPDC004531]
MYLSAADSQNLVEGVAVIVVGVVMCLYGLALLADFRGLRSRRQAEWDHAVKRARLHDPNHTPALRARINGQPRLRAAVSLAGGVASVAIALYVLQ